MGRFRERLKSKREIGQAPGQRLVRANQLLRKSKVTAEEIQKTARGFAADAMEALGDIVKDPRASPVAKISAAQTLLDRAYGRPTQTNINASVNSDDKPSQITDKELNRRIEAALRAAEDLTRAAGTPKRKREKIQGEERPADIRKLH